MAKPKKGGFGGNIFGQPELEKPQQNVEPPQPEQQEKEPPAQTSEYKAIPVPQVPSVSNKQAELKRTRYTIMIEEELLQNVKLFATLKRRKIYEIFEVALSGYLDANFTAEHRQRLEELQNLE